MSLIALISAKGSPGVTTAAVALGATWPDGRQLLIAECDPAGGDLAHRFGLSADPGLVSLAAASRRETTSVDDHLQTLPGGLRVLVGPVAGEQATAALSMLLQSSSISELSEDIDVIVDCGRIDFTSPALPLIARADLVVIVTRPIVTDVSHVVATLPLLRSQSDKIALLVTGKGPHSAEEVASALEVSLMGTLPYDESGAGALSGARSSERSLGRSALLRSAKHISGAIVELLTSTATLSEAS